VTDINLEAMAEALYLESYPYLHGGAPPSRVWGDLPGWQRGHWLQYATQLAETYRCTLVPVAERTFTLREVNPELHERIHGR
jgi:hypothetical protein